MTDTSPEIQLMINEIYKRKSGEDKLLMALDMCDTAREIVISSLKAGITDKEIRKKLFLRFYGNDFNEFERKKILARIDEHL